MSRPGILKSCDYRNTNEITMGVRVLRSGPRQGCEPDQLRTPPGLTLEEWRDLASEIEARAKERAEAIVREAEEDAERIREAAREEGYSRTRQRIRRGICCRKGRGWGRVPGGVGAPPGVPLHALPGDLALPASVGGAVPL